MILVQYYPGGKWSYISSTLLAPMIAPLCDWFWLLDDKQIARDYGKDNQKTCLTVAHIVSRAQEYDVQKHFERVWNVLKRSKNRDMLQLRSEMFRIIFETFRKRLKMFWKGSRENALSVSC